MVYTGYDDSAASALLERSPSLVSRSSGASTPPPITPHLPSTGTFGNTGTSTTHHWKTSNGNDGFARSQTGAVTPSASMAGHEKGLFGYQAKMLSRTGSIQSITSPNHLSSSASGLPRAPTLHSDLSSSTSFKNNNPTSNSAKRTTWAPGHRIANSAGNFDDIKGRFGGRSSPVLPNNNSFSGSTSGRPGSPNTGSNKDNSTPSWRRNLLARSTTSPNIENIAPVNTNERAYGPASSAPLASPTSYSGKESFRAMSPPLTGSSAPLESEIMRHSFSANSASNTSNRSSVHLGGVKGLGQSSVGFIRNLREFAVTGDGGASGVDRKMTLSGGGAGTHRRTRTLPNIGYDPAAEVLQEKSRASTPDKEQKRDSAAGFPRSRTKLNMHGLDRLSERSDTSDTYSHTNGSSHHDHLGIGSPSSSPTKASHGRRMASDAGENETGELLIPGITVGGGEVAGLSGRLRLARQPTQSKYGTLPSTTVKAMESQRQCLQAYEYLCHVSEAKEWLVACLNNQDQLRDEAGNRSPEVVTSPTMNGFQNGEEDEDPSGLSNKSVVELEEALRNGVAIARLARAFMGAKAVPRIFTAPRPRFRHSDNINYFFQFCASVNLPEIFCFELTDLYDAKNLPKVIYCIHALSHLLARRGMAQRISNLIGKIDFTDEELRKKQKGLDDAGIAMPSFGNIGKQLAKEINEEPEPEPEPEETEDEIRQRLLDEAEPSVVSLQAALRGHLVRRAYEAKHDRLQRATRTYISFQAQCRGKLAHQRLQEALLARADTHLRSSRFVLRLQTAARGCLARKKYAEMKQDVHNPAVKRAITAFQAQARRALVQKRFYSSISQLDAHDVGMTGLQARIRGRLARERYDKLLFALSESVEGTIGLQAHIRGKLARKSLLNRVRCLRETETQKAVSGFQSVVRGVLARKAQAKVAQDMRKVEVVRAVGSVQAFARGALMRKRQQQQSKALGFVMPDVVGVQAQIRGVLARRRHWSWFDYLQTCQAEATHLQALLRGQMARNAFYKRLEHYHRNLDKIVKVQAVFRRKQQAEQYRQLTKGINVPLSTLKNFIHLLADNDNDYREEVEVEELKKMVVTKIRANQALEADVSDLDIRIALLVKNKMSLDDVERARRHGTHGTLGHKQRNSVLAAAKDPFALASLDKATLRKLELYQQMFYMLQTRPEYLARLFFRLSRIEMGDRSRKAVEGVVLTLFGYAQNSREEFLLLKLFQRSIHEEVMAIEVLQDFVKSDFLFIKLVVQYGRGAKERKFLQDMLAPLINDVVNDSALDLETDPLSIYRACIAKEEMEKGLASQRPLEGVTQQKALEDPEVRVIFIRHLQLLRAKTDQFLNGIFSSTPRMPFGMRYIAREIFRALEVKFSEESKESLIRVVGHFLYYRYINPAVVAPESFDVVAATIGPAQRKNLAAISKMLNQVAVGRHFAEENPYLAPLNEYVSYGRQRFRDWFFSVLDVPDAETQFNADEYLDHSLPHKPIIYISPNEIYSMHSLVLQHLDTIAESQRDPMRALVAELGGAPQQNGAGSTELEQARAGEIPLELKGKLAELHDPRSGEKALFAATKRYVLYLLKVQPAENLLMALIEEVTPQHEEAWEMVVREEVAASGKAQMAKRSNSSPNLSGPSMEDIKGLSFRQLKARCLENMLELEKVGRVQRADNFQDIVNAVATDIRNKHRKRMVRHREIQAMEGTITSLDDKHKYLEQQLQAFRDFVNSTKTTIQKKGKRRLVIPFSAQYFHNRELARTGRSPKFGSYKYTAKALADRGILLSIEGFSPKQYDNISLTISSDEVGIFTVEASMLGVKVPDGQVELSMDELLQAQFNAKQTLNLGGMAKCNLNLLLSLINKKFYS